MNKDIRVSLGFLDHPKTIKLERRLGWPGIKSLMRLWFFCAENRPEGDLSGMDAEEIEIAAKWNGKAGLFVSTLEELKWLDRRDETGFLIHDWPDHEGYVIHSRARMEKARKAAEVRWTRKRGGPDDGLEKAAGDAKTQISIASGIAPSMVEQCPLPSPSPAPLAGKRTVVREPIKPNPERRTPNFDGGLVHIGEILSGKKPNR